MIIRKANLDDPWDQQAVVDLLDAYARDPFGDDAPLPPDIRRELIPALRQQSGNRTFLAIGNSVPAGAAVPAGIAVCFFGFSTFRAKPLLNIHDLAVVPEFRGQGVGRALLRAVEDEARRHGCCRITLEVHSDNDLARGLYRDFGFVGGDTGEEEYLFWKKPLD